MVPESVLDILHGYPEKYIINMTMTVQNMTP